MSNIDVRQLPRYDQGVLGAGLLAFIASFFPYYGATASFLGRHASTSTSAWHSWNTVGLLLIIAATLVAAVEVFARASLPTVQVPWSVIALGLSALGTVLIIIRSFTLDHGKIAGFSYGLRWGAYVLMILCLAQVVFAFLRVRERGDALPWEHRSA